MHYFERGKHDMENHRLVVPRPVGGISLLRLTRLKGDDGDGLYSSDATYASQRLER